MTNFPTADKSLGQHFLRDQTVINKITEDFKGKSDALLEIGPGPGILTKFLAKQKLPFHVIEKDTRFPELLEKFIPKENIHLLDALKCDYQEFFSELEWLDKKVWLISNLPYNVGSPIFVKALQVPTIKMMTLMFQREVADKVIAIDTRKGKSMNSLMALSQTFFNVSLLCKVPPGAFSPPPKVDSAVISLERIENPVIDLSDFRRFESFLRGLFQFKRKQLGKVLSGVTSKEIAAQTLEKLGLERNIRAESLELEVLQQIYLTSQEIRNGN
jgi:16S rRNA (adenine1518-N6/adenine1519-N6)-dimethyltransferase